MPTTEIESPRVCFVTLVLTHYRVAFHERVHAMLAADGIDYELIYSAPIGDAAARADTADLAWGTKVGARRFSIFGRSLFWQPVLGVTKGAALVIASQENKLLANYWFQLRQILGTGRFAFWGHGRNFQSRRPDGFSERLKRYLALHAHWWFAYTPGTGQLLESFGYPSDRITVFNNSVDVSKLTSDLQAIAPADIDAFRRELDIGEGPIGLYVGGMYPEKRIDFLVNAARQVHALVPSFRLLLVGAGPDAHIASEAARQHQFIRYLGPRFGRDKALCAAAAQVFLMPGLVGLAVLDTFAYGLPMITVASQHHSPEIKYLEEGGSGLILPDISSETDYAEAVVKVLADVKHLDRLRARARSSAHAYSIEAMAERFCAGIRSALARA